MYHGQDLQLEYGCAQTLAKHHTILLSLLRKLESHANVLREFYIYPYTLSCYHDKYC